MASTLMALKGKLVIVILRTPVSVNGVEVKAVQGTFGGGTMPGLFAVNKIMKAKGPDNSDVTEAADLKGKGLVANTANMDTIISGK